MLRNTETQHFFLVSWPASHTPTGSDKLITLLSPRARTQSIGITSTPVVDPQIITLEYFARILRLPVSAFRRLTSRAFRDVSIQTRAPLGTVCTSTTLDFQPASSTTPLPNPPPPPPINPPCSAEKHHTVSVPTLILMTRYTDHRTITTTCMQFSLHFPVTRHFPVGPS